MSPRFSSSHFSTQAPALPLLACVVLASSLGAAKATAEASPAPLKMSAQVQTVSVGEEGFRCPGDDPGFWMDYRAGGWVGYGETWNLDTCSQGTAVYAEGANWRWPDMRPQLANRKMKPMLSDAEILFYTNVLPYVAFGVLGLAFLLAWGMTFLDRFRKRTVRMVACEGCGVRTPIEKEEGGVFCPRCGEGVPYSAPPGSVPPGRPPGDHARDASADPSAE